MAGCFEDEISVDSFTRNYELGKAIGNGSFGNVYIAKHRLTRHNVAVKILNRQKIKIMDMEEKVGREIKILKSFMHPNIIRVYEVIETQSLVYLVVECAKIGELFECIVEKGKVTEDEARKFFQQIISAVEYCHMNMVVFRDLKPGNLLLDYHNNVKIVDLGFSNIMCDGYFMKTSCGSPNYAAPEVISGNFYSGPEVDVWSCGIILYGLLCGTRAFEDESFPNLFKKIKGGIYYFPKHVSDCAKDLISRILRVDPTKRLTIAEIRAHPWFRAQLPCDLAISPQETNQRVTKIDEDILQEVVELGFDRNALVESLHNKEQTELDNRYHHYLVDGFEETLVCDYDNKNSLEVVASSVEQLHTVAIDFQQFGNLQFPADRKWALGFQSWFHPHETMAAVLKALQELNVCWKKNRHYNMKCRWVPLFGNESTSAQNVGVSRTQNVIKFEVQLYKVLQGGYMIDLKKLEGSDSLFLDLCAAFGARLGFL